MLDFLLGFAWRHGILAVRIQNSFGGRLAEENLFLGEGLLVPNGIMIGLPLLIEHNFTPIPFRR
jgi:hypothetical protein